jgi:hypothetical protein
MNALYKKLFLTGSYFTIAIRHRRGSVPEEPDFSPEYLRPANPAQWSADPMLAEDDGKTWPYSLVLDTRESVSYPDLAEGENGVLYIVHDRERDNRSHLNRETWKSDAAKEILLSKVTVADLYAGELGENSYVSRVISKAGIDDVEK